MATGLSSTETTETATAAMGGSRSARRKTSHLKQVPETLELRESLRARCEDVASRLDRSVPMTKDEMEQVARRTLEEADLPEGYLGWMMVMLSSCFLAGRTFSRSSRATLVPVTPLFEARRRLPGRVRPIRHELQRMWCLQHR